MIKGDRFLNFYEVPEDTEVYPKDLTREYFPYQFYGTSAELRRGKKEYFNDYL